jgi:hypothetical protein
MDDDEAAQRRSAEHVTRNSAVFREANERLREAAQKLGHRDLFPVLCECADARCTELVWLSLDEYERLRAQARLFVQVRGHDLGDAGWVRVVEGDDRYVVVEKTGEAAAIVDEIKPRADASGDPA